MLKRCWPLAVTIPLVAALFAPVDEAPAAAAPAAPPGEAEIEGLIGQLGADDPARRREAAARLEAAGGLALDRLRQAARGDGDPDFRLRAAVTARAITDALYGGQIRRFDPPYSLVQRVAFLPDGRVLSGHDDSCLRVWDAGKGKELLCLRGHVRRVMGVAGSPDGKRALSGGEDGTVRLWDLATGKELRQFKGHGDWVMTVEFSPDGKHALSCSGGHWDQWWRTGTDTTARLWDVETGKEVRRFTGHTGLIFHAAFLPGGKRAVTSSLDRTARVWDVATGKELLRLAHDGEVHCAASPDGRRLVTGSTDGGLRVWDADTGKLLRTVRTGGTIHALTLTTGGKRALTHSWYGPDPALRLWDLTTGEEVTRFPFLEGAPTAVAISADGRRAVSGDSWGRVRLWRLGK
jgi:WD40 repeat protein